MYTAITMYDYYHANIISAAGTAAPGERFYHTFFFSNKESTTDSHRLNLRVSLIFANLNTP